MICKRCMVVMGAGTTYERRNEKDESLAKRFYECKKCGERVYTHEPNFQECMSRASEKHRNR